MHTVTALALLQPCPKSELCRAKAGSGPWHSVCCVPQGRAQLCPARGDVPWRRALLHSDDALLRACAGPGQVARDCQSLRAVFSELLQVLAM